VGKRSFRALLAAILSIQILTPNTTAKAAEQSALGSDIPRIRSCQFEPLKNCIVSIKGVFPDGKEIEAKPTGRNRISDWSWGKNSKVTGPTDEWEFPGVTFENGNGKFLLTTFYFPDGLSYCWANGTCDSHQEQLNFYANPSDLDMYKPATKVVGRKAELACPNDVNNCTFGAGWSFKKDVKFIITFKFENDFVPTISTGRVKQLKIGYSGTTEKLLVVEFVPLVLEHVPYDKPDLWIFEEAFDQNDNPAIWIHGNRHSLVQSLGQCTAGGGLQVVSNAIGIGVPTWNAVNKSIDVWVKSPHLAVDGKPLKGYLEVRIPIKMAKCLWNIDLNGEISGKVSITYENSATPELLTVTGTVSGNDYLMVSTGYHYSAPTIAIQLNNKQAVAVETPQKSQEEMPVVQPIKKVKKSISCKKGAKVKKVTAVAPKCPIGFKKVA
jgi:hypothetical protein